MYLADADVRVFGLQGGHGLFDAAGDGGVAGAFAAVNAEADDFPPVQAGAAADFAVAVADVGEFAQGHAAAIIEGDGGSGESGDIGGATRYAQAALAVVGGEASGGDIDVGLYQLAVDLRGADAQGFEAFGAQGNGDFPLAAAVARDLLHAGDGQQAADGVIDEPRQCRRVHVRRFEGVVGKCAAFDVHPADERFVDAGGQVGADLCNGVAHVVHGAVGIDV